MGVSQLPVCCFGSDAALRISGSVFVMRSPSCIFGGLFSRRTWVDAAQLAETAHVVGEGLHPDPGPGPRQTDGSHDGAAHVIGLRAKDMLDPDSPNSQTCGFGPVALLGRSVNGLPSDRQGIWKMPERGACPCGECGF